MSVLDNLKKETADIVTELWRTRDGQVVPEAADVALGNDGVFLDATFLYADLADSTELAVHNQYIAAEVCKAYLRGTTRIIRSLGGEIRSFDGDRVMGVFLGDSKNTNAAKAGLQINYFFKNILKSEFEGLLRNPFPNGFALRQSVGIDTARTLVSRAGIRSNNDLTWIGRAPNVAAKLSSIRDGDYSTFITQSVYERLADESKFGGTPQRLMWSPHLWPDGIDYGNGMLIQKSGWSWSPP